MAKKNNKTRIEDLMNDALYQAKKNTFEHNITQRIYNKDIGRLFISKQNIRPDLVKETTIRIRLGDKLEKKRKEELQQMVKEFEVLVKELVDDLKKE